ncbi:MAG: phosphotransferase [Halanaerobiales bacterium]|nr:phosphotransferase [Halanaerobiales bacterium]
MQIPEYFNKKIIRAFGDKGSKWLENLPQIFEKCVEKWNLTNYSVANNLSYNLICFAKSTDYGEVALKIGVPHPELFTEMKALSIYEGRNICKCYDSNMELGVLLLERITPGPDLTTQNTNTQLQIAAELISKIPIPITKNHGLPTFADWITKAFKRASEEDKVGSKMLSLIEEAEKLFREIETNDRPKVLLHGDLHHWNILQDQNGNWKAIDPKGVIGVHCMESGRFMRNHIDMVKDTEKFEHLNEMVTAFSTKFDETKRIIASCLFVDYILGICWSFEEASPEPDKLVKSINDCEFIYNYIIHFLQKNGLK